MTASNSWHVAISRRRQRQWRIKQQYVAAKYQIMASAMAYAAYRNRQLNGGGIMAAIVARGVA